MSTPFGAGYAGAYDALYRDKDYVAEAAFVLAQLRTILPTGEMTILDLGCGTGLHAVELARAGCDVVGVDRSPEMIEAAEARRRSLPPELSSRLRFEVGDMRSADLGRTFDAVVSLFHVVCYMTDDAALDEAFITVRRHLKVGGPFLFDFWHGPAVLADPPTRREKTIELSDRTIHRTTDPRWDRDRGIVHVGYTMTIVDRASGETSEEVEEHSVRYFDPVELEPVLAKAGLQSVRFGEWLTAAPASTQSFGVYCLAVG